MKAMIFAAGLGTRLRPLTNDRPKALVEINGVSLLEINIKRLIHFGVREIIINTHHFADKIEDFLRVNKNFGIEIVTSHEAEAPLETGGGLKKAAWFFENDDTPFIVCNADILSTIDIEKMYHWHKKTDALATYATQQRDTNRYMLHNTEGLMCGWMNTKSKEIKICRQAAALQMCSFSCFHVINPAIFATAPPQEYFSMIDWYLAIGGQHKILGYRHDSDLWCDVGKPETLIEAEILVKNLL
jgi:NDP-sugar pyrophosphorylase family protein